ncbi:PDZ domain-containing protein [Microbacterium sp. Marseille-Q6965]|uniref:YlbL family protein n=1 Tax=Microbacterium sp. Marseille-Q6965 TaxID=2965072 RepID=UPI0021B82A8B|nr:S16 family serine protease [Microbacterium sp. Marseille-Q6965]
MSLFDEPGEKPGSTPLSAIRRMSRRTAIGAVSLAVALVVLFALTLMPSGYVIQQPGPVYNTIGVAENAEGEDVPLIEVQGAETYETGGSLDLTTVQVVGNRDWTPRWIQVAAAWLDPSKAVVPLDAVFPRGTTSEQREEQNAMLMVDSQADATAAALRQLGYDIGSRIQVVSLTDDSPANGLLHEGDVITTADGAEVTDVARLRELIQRSEGEPIEVGYVREGEAGVAEITPARSVIEGEEAWAIGVSLTTDYDDFPVDVHIQLDNVGGPSAGTMFALGIIDVLTPGEATGGEDIAGTGTIDGAGEVGPIGGIRQKLHGARDAGAEWFLAPRDNCDQVVGHVPDGLTVVSIASLDDAVAAVEAIAAGDADELPSCAAG